jgi:hypothetical protein
MSIRPVGLISTVPPHQPIPANADMSTFVPNTAFHDEARQKLSIAGGLENGIWAGVTVDYSRMPERVTVTDQRNERELTLDQISDLMGALGEFVKREDGWRPETDLRWREQRELYEEIVVRLGHVLAPD